MQGRHAYCLIFALLTLWQTFGGVRMVAGSGGVGRGGVHMLGSVSFAVRGCALRIAFHGLLAIASMAASMVPAAAQ